MRWMALSGLGLAAVITVGMAGCGGNTLDEGMPQGEPKADIPLDPKMVDMSGASFADQKKAAAKNIAASKATPPPAPPTGAENE